MLSATRRGPSSTRSVLSGTFSGFGYNSMECSVRVTDHPSCLVYRVLVLLGVQVHRNILQEVTDRSVGTSHVRVPY